MAGVDFVLGPLFIRLQAAARKLKQVHKSLEAAEYAYSTQAAHAAELEQRVNQLAGQLPEVQDDLVTGRQQQAELQQQLSAAQAKICSTLQQLMQLNDSLATLKAKVGHQCINGVTNCTLRRAQGPGPGCSIRGSMLNTK
jgi:chromosome segregation ATPase